MNNIMDMTIKALVGALLFFGGFYGGLMTERYREVPVEQSIQEDIDVARDVVDAAIKITEERIQAADALLQNTNGDK